MKKASIHEYHKYRPAKGVFEHTYDVHGFGKPKQFTHDTPGDSRQERQAARKELDQQLGMWLVAGRPRRRTQRVAF